MVLPAPPPDDAPRTREAPWLARLNGVLQLVQNGVLVLIDQAHPERLGELVRSLLPAHPDLEVHTDAVRLARAEKGSLIILVPDPEQATWLNLERPIFANRALRVILFSTAETSSCLARRAPDFFSWISHRIECPDGQPLPAVRGIRAALRTRARGVAWTGGDFEAVFHAALPGRTVVRASAAMPYEQMVEAAKPAGKSWVAWSDVDGPFRLRRVRWAMAEAGRRGRSVLIAPDVEAPGFLRVDGRLTGIKEACAGLEAAGATHAGRLAALMDLDPELVKLASSLLKAGTEEETIEAAARGAVDTGSAVTQLAAGGGAGAGGTPHEAAGGPRDPVEALLLDRGTDARRWVKAADAAIREDDAEVGAFWARRGLRELGEDQEALRVAGEALERCGAYAEAETLLRKSISLAEAEGKIVQGAAPALTVLARVLWSQGWLQDAEKLLRKVVKIEKMAAGATHSDYSVAIHGLALVLRERGRYEEAEKLLREAASITKRNEGKESSNYPAITRDLGTVLLLRGKRGAAETLFREALTIFSRTIGTENSQYAYAAHSLGRCLLEQHEYSEAESNLRIAAAVHAKIWGLNHPVYAYSLHELARCLAGQGAYGEAERELRRALTILESSPGVQSPYYTASLHELGVVLLHRGRYVDAEQMFRLVLTIEQKSLGDEHPVLCPTLCDLGLALARQGQLVAGEQMVLKSIEIAKKGGLRHPDIGIGLLTLTRMQAARGGVEALATARRALDALQHSVGTKAPEYKEAAQLVEDLSHASSTNFGGDGGLH